MAERLLRKCTWMTAACLWWTHVPTTLYMCIYMHHGLHWCFNHFGSDSMFLLGTKEVQVFIVQVLVHIPCQCVFYMVCGSLLKWDLCPLPQRTLAVDIYWWAGRGVSGVSGSCWQGGRAVDSRACSVLAPERGKERGNCCSLCTDCGSALPDSLAGHSTLVLRREREQGLKLS